MVFATSLGIMELRHRVDERGASLLSKHLTACESRILPSFKIDQESAMSSPSVRSDFDCDRAEYFFCLFGLSGST